MNSATSEKRREEKNPFNRVTEGGKKTQQNQLPNFEIAPKW